jgi:predicted aldo/keto reductase-like oxidoreductase
MHGIYQGNGAGPSIWAVLSSPILDQMREKGFGIQLISPISRTNIKFAGYSFVDDTDLLQVISALQQYRFAIISIQRAFDTWEAGLKVTGGALVPEKNLLVPD